MSVENQATSAVGRRKPQIVRDSLDDPEELRRGPHAADELPRLLEALGISARDLARVEPIVGANLERVCTLCKRKPECNRDLASGASAEHYQEYCLNASRTWSWSTTSPKMMALIGMLRALNAP